MGYLSTNMSYLKNLFSTLVQDKIFFKSMLAIALPVALQNLIQSGLNMVDTLMIGRLGEAEIGAVALSNQIFFLLILILFGINSGASVFASQYWGNKNTKGLRESLSLALVLSFFVSLLFLSGTLLIPKQILSLYSKDSEVVNLGTQYLRIAGLSYIPTAITLSFSSSLRCTGIVKLTTKVSAISLTINTLLNFFLIFGIGPFPPMGVQGAALATVIARSVETIILLIFIYKNQYPSAIGVADMQSVTSSFIKRYFVTSTPVILNEIAWSFGITTINLIFARIGTEALASFSISDTISKLFVIFFFGTSSACAVMVGNRIGAGEEDKAKYYGHSFMLLAPLLGVFIGLLLIPIAPYLPYLFNISTEAREGITTILRLMALFFPFKIFNWHMVVGILRSGGDTKFSLYMEAGGIWLVAVPAAAITGLVFHLPLGIIYLALSMEEIVKFLLSFNRLKSGKWIKNVIH